MREPFSESGFDANQAAEEIHADISAMLRGSPEAGAEEWAVHDYEGFGEISLSEWPDISRVSAIAKLLGDHGMHFLFGTRLRTLRTWT